MDHIELPRDPVRSPPRIQYYCLEEYDRGDFDTYPERQGWTQTELFTISTWREADGVLGRGRTATLAFLQQWLFFGLLHAAFGDAIVFQDYIDEANSKKYIHTRNLLAHANQVILKQKSGLATANDLPRLDRSLQTAYLAYQFITREPAPALDPYFLLSLSLLGRFITCLQQALFRDKDPMSFINRVVWEPPFVRADNYTDLLKHEMMEQGWCPRAVDKLQQLVGLESRYFNSFLRNLRKDQRHGGVCTRTQCLATQMQKSTYRTVHSSDSCSCLFKGFDQAAVEHVLEAGELPLVAWNRSNGVVELISAKFNATYVAISHVWSDGLGNPHANAIPQCQFEVLNDLVQSLYPGKAEQIPFWIDTLCCPAISSNGKRIAIRKMRDTYACANKVLVLDNGLRSIDVTGRSVAELAFYIHSSNWSSRLWTFQEGALPETLIFQFMNATLDSQEILSTALRFNFNFKNGWGSALDLVKVHHSVRGDDRDSKKPYKAPVMKLAYCAIALITRTTSVQEDESLCLAGLMDIDPASLLSVNPKDRLMHFLAQLPHISQEWIYYPYSRMESVGFRWAPKTLLGIGTGRWYTDANATPTKNGLLVSAYSITLWSLNFPLSHSISSEVWIPGTDDHWGYYIAKGSHGYEHYTVPEGRFSRVALLMTSRIYNSSMSPCTHFVMVFVTGKDDGVTYARRADSGLIFDANHPACQGRKLHAFQIGKREHLLGAMSDNVTKEGVNYLVGNDYHAVVGDWADEKSKWCID